MLKVLLLLTFAVPLAAGDTHTVQIFNTAVTAGTPFPEFTSLSLLDGVQFEYYDSDIRRKIPKTEWVKRIDDDDPGYWDTNTQVLQDTQETFKANLPALMQRFNQTTGVHTWQWMVGCELDDDGPSRGSSQYGYDGEDFISFDLKTFTWIALTPQALITKHRWDQDAAYINYLKSYLEKDCTDWMNRLLSYGEDALGRKARPEASVFQKHSSPPEVVCHATGFFPKTVMVSWQKDGQDVLEDVELRETLPNQDGSFQTRSVLRVPAEELQKHTYTCVIQHSSLGEEKLVLEVPRGGGSDGVQTGIGVAVVLLALTGGVGFLIWKKKSGRAKASFHRSD